MAKPKSKTRLGPFLREMREAAGLTQVELAKRLRTQQPSIAKMESPRYPAISTDTLRRVALACRIRLELRAQGLRPVRLA